MARGHDNLPDNHGGLVTRRDPALTASKGGHAPTYINIGANLITKGTLSSARSQELLHPTI